MYGFDPGWSWAIAGVILLIAETIAPGFFLFFIGVAALGTGLLTEALGLPATAQTLLFALFAALAVALGRRWYARSSTHNLDPLLNDRAARLVGRTVEVVDPIDEHGGRVRVADGAWSARGGPAAAGDMVRVIGVDGNCLTVVAIEPTDPPSRQRSSA